MMRNAPPFHSIDPQFYSQIRSATYEAYVFSKDQIIKIFTEKISDKEWREKMIERNLFVKTAMGYILTGKDTISLGVLLKKIGISARYYLKSVHGNEYVIFKGRSALREIFRGTRYSSNNPNIIAASIGKRGIRGSLKQGARIAIIGCVAINIINAILSDTSFLSFFLGTMSTDIGKIGLASLVGYRAATLFVSGSSIVAGAPIFAMIVAGFGVGWFLDEFDDRRGLTKWPIEAIYEAEKEIKKDSKTAIENLCKKFNINCENMWNYNINNWLLNNVI